MKILSPESINILLLASDELWNLLSNASASNNVDISSHIEALTAVASGSGAENTNEKNAATENTGDVPASVDIAFPDGGTVFTVPRQDIAEFRKEGKYVYLIEFDLIQDVHQKGKSPREFIQ